MVLKPYVRTQRTLNEQLAAAEIIKQILLLRLSLYVRNRIIDALNDTERPIASMIRDSLVTEAGLRDRAQARALERLINEVNAVRSKAWDRSIEIAESETSALAQAEAEDQKDIHESLLPGIGLRLPSGVGSLVLATAFQGRRLRRWMTDARDSEARRFRRLIYAGAGMGDDPATVARAIVGTSRARGRNGTTQTSRNHVNSIIRSGLVHAGASAREQFYGANQSVVYFSVPLWQPLPIADPGTPDDAALAEARLQAARARASGTATMEQVFLLEQYVAILDNRTTRICRRLDGDVYRVGEGPIPPVHVNCRSMRYLVLPTALGGELYDPGKYSDWIVRQPRAVRRAFAGSRNETTDLAGSGFRDYGAKPMSLNEVRQELRTLLRTYN